MVQASASDERPRPRPRLSLEYAAAEQQRLGEHLLRLAPEQLEHPSNLPGWRVLDLAVHITRVCDSIVLAVTRARVGDQTPAFGAAARPREEAIRAMTVQGWVDLQRNACAELIRQVAEMSAEELERSTFPHPQGQRSVRWFCTQVLAELAFHRWDLGRSLGEQAQLDEERATYLLPFLLDPAEPLFGQLRAPDGSVTFSLSSAAGTWVLTSTPDGTRVDAPSDGSAPRIRATPGWLALAVYGRVRIDTPPFAISGPPETADRFAAIYGPR